MPFEFIEPKNIQFTYPGKAEPPLRDLTMTIGVN